MSEIRERVRESYAKTARELQADTRQGCCARSVRPQAPASEARAAGPASASCGCSGPVENTAAPEPAAGSECCFGASNYGSPRVVGIPDGAVRSSLGCGDPTLFAELHAGQHVLDLGSGGGLDAFLAARAVGPTGFVYGVDMTGEMLALAERNRLAAGVANAAFVNGFLEDLPFDDRSFDVVISNCVINLVADKDLVLRECHRVLRPGGRLAVSDTVLTRPVEPEVRNDQTLWSCCISGALEPDEYRSKLTRAGFVDVSVEVSGDQEIGGVHVASARVRARKPAQPLQPWLREARPDDLDAIQRLLAASGLPAAGLAMTYLIVAEIDGTIAGSAGLEWHGDYALLRSVVVRRDLRAQGLGGRLVAEALDTARARGAKGLYLLTTTADRFFARIGFHVVNRSDLPPELDGSPELQGACPATATAMALAGC